MSSLIAVARAGVRDGVPADALAGYVASSLTIVRESWLRLTGRPPFVGRLTQNLIPAISHPLASGFRQKAGQFAQMGPPCLLPQEAVGEYINHLPGRMIRLRKPQPCRKPAYFSVLHHGCLHDNAAGVILHQSNAGEREKSCRDRSSPRLPLRLRILDPRVIQRDQPLAQALLDDVQLRQRQPGFLELAVEQALHQHVMH